MRKVLACLAVILLTIINYSPSFAQIKKKAVKKTVLHTSKTKVQPKTDSISTEKFITEVRVKITTSLGDIVLKLSNKTPKHRDNFIKLVNEHFYDSLLFHRVINNFMIQGGDPNSKNALAGTLLGNGDIHYTIPAEFDTTLYHKRGALAAARDNNPEKASSGCQFYIVQGKQVNGDELDIIELQKNIWFSAAKRMTYKMNGGTPKLDMNYTVFGEVETGMEVVEKIITEQTDENNRPKTDVRMKMEVLKEIN